MSESTDFIQFTPPSTNLEGNSFSVTEHLPVSNPYPGATFIIRSAASGHVLKSRDNQAILEPMTEIRSEALWTCTTHEGWRGFRNKASGRFLGRDNNGYLGCFAGQQSDWEKFVVECIPDGAFVLRQEHWWKLYPIAMRFENGAARLAKLMDVHAAGFAFEFCKVE